MNLTNIFDASLRACLTALEYATLNRLIGGPVLAVGTTATKFKVSAFTYSLGGQVLAKAAADSIAFPGASTGAGQFRKVLICIDAAGAVSTVAGDIAASQVAALLPEATAGTLPIGYLELPAAFTSGTTSVTAPMCKAFTQSVDVKY